MEKRRNITASAVERSSSKEQNAQAYVNKFDAKNYVDIKLKPGENRKEIKFRPITVDKDSDELVKKIYSHTIAVPTDISKSGWKGYVCLSKTEGIDNETFGDACPFCEMREDALKKMYAVMNAAKEENRDYKEDPEYQRWQAIANKYRPDETAIIRGIERGENEKDGPKFIKCNIRSDGKDLYSSMMKLYNERKQESIDAAMEENDGVLPEDFEPDNIFDLYTGKDLKIIIERVFDKNNKPTKKTSISVVDCAKPRPLSNNEDQIDEWLDDEKKWDDVFVIKTYEYCDIVLEGKVPYFDKKNNKWIPKEVANTDASQDEAKKKADSEAENKIKSAESKAIEAAEDEDYDSDEISDDGEESEELPF